MLETREKNVGLSKKSVLTASESYKFLSVHLPISIFLDDICDIFSASIPSIAMNVYNRPKRSLKRKSLSEEVLFGSINAAIGDNQEKLIISADYKPSKKSNGRPEYFTLPQIIDNAPCIVVKWADDEECVEKLEILLEMRENYLYDLIPWILNVIRPNENESDSKIKEYIKTIWKSPKTVQFYLFFHCFERYPLKLMRLFDFRLEFSDWYIC